MLLLLHRTMFEFLIVIIVVITHNHPIPPHYTYVHVENIGLIIL